jgi:hypothetical protein
MELGLFSQKKVEYQNEDINRAGNDTLSIAASRERFIYQALSFV